MKKSPTRYLITAALPYANGPLHIGHIAGCYLPADIYTRFLKLKGEDVLFICGSDEHGVPITITAAKEGVTPQQVVDKYHHLMQHTFLQFGIHFDFYGRTSSKIHHQTAQAFFRRLHEKGILYKKETEQYFDPEKNQFLADRYIVGICPKCSNPNAYGDQCEKCGTTLSPDELIQPKSTLSGAEPIKMKTDNWFLPLDKLQPKIEAYLKHHKHWKPNVLGQCKSWLQQGEGLHARSMTRDLDWGVPVPLPEAHGKVLYVWFDAPIGYISNTIAYFENKSGHEQDWKKYWQDETTALVHFIGKDNIVFHCIIFPAMLMEHGEFITAEDVPANEFLNLEGQKISTSRHHAVWLHEYLQDFPEKKDELRYVLTSIAPENKDSDFTWADFQLKINSELVAIFGNFINRVLVLTHKFFEGKVPDAKELIPDTEIRKKCFDSYQNTHAELVSALQNMTLLLSQKKIREAQFQMMQIARIGNKYLAETEPWKLFKTDADAVAPIMNYALCIAANLAIASEPFLPETSIKIKHLLGEENFKIPTLHFWKTAELQDVLPIGFHINMPQLLFPQITDEEIQAQMQRLNPSPIGEIPAGLPPIEFSDFSKLELRTGKIIHAEKLQKSDKLLVLQVNIGIEIRQIVSGIALHFKPEEIIGKQVSVLVNLAPKKIRGIDSKGMILMAENQEGKLQFINPDQQDFELGARIS